MSHQRNLAGKVAIITGSSRGIGAAIARALAKEGAAVVINYLRNEAKARQVLEEIHSFGGRSMMVKADVTNRQDVDRMVATTLEEWQVVDILVNNAHSAFVSKPFTELTWEDVQEQINGTIQGAFNCTQAVLTSMIPRRTGKIINIVSISVDSPELGFGLGMLARNTAKAALVGFSRHLAFELAPLEITVNMVSPGWTATDQAAAFPEELQRRAAERTPMGRLTAPEDTAGAVLFYASDWSRFVTGTYLPVCGGAVM